MSEQERTSHRNDPMGRPLRRRMPAIAVAALTLLATVAQGSAVQAAVPATEADYSGYATSTPVHLDAVNR